MSTDDKLTFPCPACQSTLKVPHQLAGVKGPCPQCGTEIIAPNPASQSAARLVAMPQLAGVGAGYGDQAGFGQPSYTPEPEFQAPAPTQVAPTPAPYNPWETPASSGQDPASHGELNLGEALAAAPIPNPPAPEPVFGAPPEMPSPQVAPPSFPPMPQSAPQASTQPVAEPPHMWAAPPQETPQAAPAFAPAPSVPNTPAPVDLAAAFPPPSFDAAANPFAQPQAPAYLPTENPVAQPAPQASAPPQAPSLFPIGNAPGGSIETAQSEKKKTSRSKKSGGKGASGKSGKSNPILIGAGLLVIGGTAAFFLIPGLKDKVLGTSEPLAVTVDTAIPVPRRPLPGTFNPAAGGTAGPGDSATVEPQSGPDLDPTAKHEIPAPGPSRLTPDPEAASKPAPDFGLGNPTNAVVPPQAPAPGTPPAEVLRAVPVEPQEAAPAKAETPVSSNTEAFQGDATATPEDVASARTILENFINAQTVEERLSYSQPAPKIEEQMRDYYAKHPTPTRATQINYTLANILEGSTKRFFIFEVTTDQQQEGFPVAVEETEGGMKVDWRSFVEFHDNMLGRFISVYRPGAESFRVILERAHYFKTDVPDLGSKLAFSIKPPIPGFEGYAFCPKDTSIGQQLDRKFAWDVKYLPIVELEWVKDEKGAKYVKVVRVIQDNWRALQ